MTTITTLESNEIPTVVSIVVRGILVVLVVVLVGVGVWIMEISNSFYNRSHLLFSWILYLLLDIIR